MPRHPQPSRRRTRISIAPGQRGTFSTPLSNFSLPRFASLWGPPPGPHAPPAGPAPAGPARVSILSTNPGGRAEFRRFYRPERAATARICHASPATFSLLSCRSALTATLPAACLIPIILLRRRTPTAGRKFCYFRHVARGQRGDAGRRQILSPRGVHSISSSQPSLRQAREAHRRRMRVKICSCSEPDESITGLVTSACEVDS